MAMSITGRIAAFSVFCGVTAASSLAVDSAAAAGLLAPLSPAEAQVAATLAAPANSLVKRTRVARLDAAELASHVAPLGIDQQPDRVDRSKSLDGVVTIELFPDAVATFKRNSIDTIGDSGFAWVGNVDGSPGEFASLIVESGEVTAHVRVGRRLFHITPLGNGLHRVSELDPLKFPPDHPAGYKYSHSTPTLRLPQQPAEAEKAKTTTINVLIAYTSRASEQAKMLYGGKNAIKDQIKQAISLANAAYVTGKIPVKLVLAAQMTAGKKYLEWNNLADNLAALEGQSVGGYPPELQSIRAKQGAVKADVVVLLTGIPADGTCGIGNFVETPGSGTSGRSYSAVNFNCISNYSVHHEIGHNMGLRHDRFVDRNPGLGYNFGYVNKLKNCRIRDVMAYDDACKAAGGCVRENIFSTGRVKFPVGTKQCVIGIAKGKPKAADNEVRLKETNKAVGKYR